MNGRTNSNNELTMAKIRFNLSHFLFLLKKDKIIKIQITPIEIKKEA
jgi:hypothetical protein